MLKSHWIIKDWAGNICFKGIQFPDFEEAEDWLSNKLGNNYETDRQEYEIVQIETNE